MTLITHSIIKTAFLISLPLAILGCSTGNSTENGISSIEKNHVVTPELKENEDEPREQKIEPTNKKEEQADNKEYSNNEKEDMFDNLGKTLEKVKKENSKSQFMFLVADDILTHRMGFLLGDLTYEFRDYRDLSTTVFEVNYGFWQDKCNSVRMKMMFYSLESLENSFSLLRDGCTNYKKGTIENQENGWLRTDTYISKGRKLEAYISNISETKSNREFELIIERK